LKIAIVAIVVVMAASVAKAQLAPVILACTPTDTAIERCEAAGGKYDTLRCKCVRPPRVPKVCSLVCVDGVLDARRCKCIQR
jgi:hypothetical protein